MIERNKIYCMDCLDGLAKLPDGCVKLFIADPPYSQGLTANGKHGDYSDLAVSKPFFRQLAQEMARTMAKNGEFYIFTDWRGMAFYYPIFEEYLPLKNCIVWDKGSGPGNFYSFSHELILYGCADPQTKKHDRNVWREKAFTSGSLITDGPKIHPSQKPIHLFQRIVLDASIPGDLVVDPFGGSGTTAVACKRTGRDFIVFEIKESRAQAAQERLEEGQAALLMPGT